MIVFFWCVGKGNRIKRGGSLHNEVEKNPGANIAVSHGDILFTRIIRVHHGDFSVTRLIL